MNIVSFKESIHAFVLSTMYGINTCIPGIVEKQDGPYRVEVTPAISCRYSDGSILEHKPIANVPIIYCRSKQAVIRLPKLQQGDTGLILFSQRALDNWLGSQDGSKNTADDPRRFDQTDAIFIPGLYPFPVEEPVASSLDNLEIIYKDASIVIKPNGDIIIDNGNCTIEMTSTQVSINGNNFTVSK